MLLQEGTNTCFSYLNPGDTIEKAVSIFLDLKIAIIPVLDQEGRLLSIFSRSSLYRAVLAGARSKDRIDPYLITDVVSIANDIPDEQLANFVKMSPVGSVPVLNKEGKVIGLLCKAKMVTTLFRHSEQDLTDLEHTAKELETVKALNETFDTVLNIIRDGIVVVDEKGKITLVNQAMADFLTIPPEEMIGKPITEIMSSNQLHHVACTGLSETSEVLTIRGKPLIVSNSPIIKEGKVVGAVGKAVFPHLAEAQELAEKVRCLEHKVTFFQEELQKNRTAQDIMKDMVAESPQMKKLKDEISIVATSTSTVLITGESGTGKEGVAHAIHLGSDRGKGPFIKVNCASIPESLMESEMFGYVGGAFTGAAKNGKPGRIERADGGTLFLDEIGEMPLALQAKLLRVLQDREIERLGSTETIKVNIRILAATNKKLSNAIAKGEFRQDLYYRLNVINLHLPPLRERLEDIEPLTHFFISKFNDILKANVSGITPNAMATLLQYSWPGNIRELENVVERAVNYTRSGLIELIHLPHQIISGNTALGQVMNKKTIRHQDRLGQIERDMIAAALEKAGGNKTKAAKLLNLSRSRLYDKLNKYDLNT